MQLFCNACRDFYMKKADYSIIGFIKNNSGEQF